MIKFILIIGVILSGVLFFKMDDSEEPVMVELETAVDKKVLGSSMFDSDFVNVMNSKVIPNLVFNIDTRFIHKIALHRLKNAKTIHDIFPEVASSKMKLINETRVVRIDEEDEVEVWGNGANLSAYQLEMINSFDYSQDFYLEAYIENQSSNKEKVVYFFTVVAEQEARYKGGQEALLDFLSTESSEVSYVIKQDKLKPGRVSFTVSENGNLEEVELDSSSGYEDYDAKMLELIRSLPAGWDPAKNIDGENVKQKLVFFFGTQGC